MMQIDKPVLLPTSYMPSIHYFMLMAAAPEVFIEKYETYPKRTFRNRCEIYSANGKLQLTIPVNRVNGHHTRADKVLISDQYDWQVLHWRAIRIAYTNSPFYLYYKDDIEVFYQKQFDNLFDFNLKLLKEVCSIIDFDVKISTTETFQKDPENMADFRHILSPKFDISGFNFKPYYQAFSEKHGFIPGLSILDLLFNMGPESLDIIL
jgi:hypothetical protein